MPVTTSEIIIPATDGSGSFKAYIAKPDDINDAPAIIMIQEIFGINDFMQETCKQAAEEGYIAICPDLFWRQEPDIKLSDTVPAHYERALELYKNFNADKALEDLEATLQRARAMPNEDENANIIHYRKTACIGYCLGGMLAYRMATETDIDASISYYGVGITKMLDQKHLIQQPLLLHIAQQDEHVPQDQQTDIIEAFKDIPFIKTQLHQGAHHAFARKGSKNYDENTALTANAQTNKFLKESL